MTKTQNFNLEMIENSPFIQDWINQFELDDQLAAKYLLTQLKFISRDDYSKWLINKLNNYKSFQKCAIYSVRKFDKEDLNTPLWNLDGQVQLRPAETQGSEDLISSIISNVIKDNKNKYWDHPSLNDLRNEKIHNIILIDDSIGIGKRIKEFICKMMLHKTFKSWWSFGFIKLHLLCYSLTIQAQKNILFKIPCSNQHKRKNQISNKIIFDSEKKYDSKNLQTYWGKNYIKIYNLCKKCTKIKSSLRFGYGDVMSNIIFYHSVPNNIPGVLHDNSNNWKPLFSNRTVPQWAIDLLENKKFQNKDKLNNKYQLNIPVECYNFLIFIKKGLRTKASLARKMNYDLKIVDEIVKHCITLGFISESIRLTDTGYDYIKQNSPPKKNDVAILKQNKYNYSLYIPTSWCGVKGIIQPSVSERRQIDSSEFFEDGDDGQSSLERTDARATSSPIIDLSLNPSMPQQIEADDGQP